MSVSRGRSRAGRRASGRGPWNTSAPAIEEPPALVPTAPVGGVRRHLGFAWRRRSMLLAATLLAGLVGAIAAHGGRPQYEATARVLVGPLGGEAKTLRASSQLVSTYSQLATSRSLLDATARRLRIPRRAVDVRVEVDGVTRLLTIRARDAGPARAAAIANAHADGLVAVSSRKGAGSARAGRLLVVDPAVPSHQAIGPSPALIAAAAALAGLLVALGVALVADRTDDSIKSGEDLEAATGAPCVGHLSRAALRAAREYAPMAAEPGSDALDEFRTLATKLDAHRGQSLLVIAMHGDATALAANIAAALAAHGARVALVDVGDTATDGGAAGHDNLPATAPGMNGNGRGPAGTVQRVEGPRLSSAGAPPAGRAEAALERLEANADLVVLHATRLERSPTALAWARVADGTVLVAERDRTAVADLRATAETLRIVGAPIAGTVLAEPATGLRR
jgi:receptor protein-tyrosine kinase